MSGGVGILYWSVGMGVAKLEAFSGSWVRFAGLDVGSCWGGTGLGACQIVGCVGQGVLRGDFMEVG